MARAILSTVGVEEGVSILIAQFGWDTTFMALAQVETPEAHQALWITVEQLCHDAA